MSNWQPCCITSALDPQSAFCTNCGRTLFRCVAYEQCKSLVEPLSHCAVCVQPRLALKGGAVLNACIGEVLSIPFLLSNHSPAGRSLQVLAIYKTESKEKNKAVQLDWEKLDGGSERYFSVITQTLKNSGIHRLRLTIVIASCSDGFEEVYAFNGEIEIEVEGNGPKKVVQNITISDSDIGDNTMLVSRQDNRDSPRNRPSSSPQDQREIPLERADRYELENGYRGYAASASRVTRDTLFVFTGFPCIDHPPEGPLNTSQPILRCGRNSRRFDEEQNPKPNHLSLRAYEAGSAKLDISTSRAISRHICDYLIQNNRLYLRSCGDNQMTQNSQPLHRDELRQVNDGDEVELPAGHQSAFKIMTRFKTESGRVKLIEFERNPSVAAE